MKKYSDPIKFDHDNFKRYLSNRRYLSLRFSSALLFGNFMISSLLAFLYEYNIVFITILSILTFINLCISLYAVFTFIFNLKKYQDSTKATENPFSKVTLIFMGWTILITSLMLPIIITIILIVKYNSSFLMLLIFSVVNILLALFNFKNTNKMIKNQDKYLKLANKF